MCFSKPSKPEPPAAAPPPPSEPPKAPALNETANSERNLVAAQRAGRSSLRIDPASAVPGAGSGLSIPTG